MTTLCKQMQAHYPHQEFATETIEGYLFDFERLAVLYGIQLVEVALLNLRIRPGVRFFPHPSEVAEEIEVQRDKERAHRVRIAQEAERQRKIREFWIWGEQWMRDTGSDEAELLRRYPTFKGTKP